MGFEPDLELGFWLSIRCDSLVFGQLFEESTLGRTSIGRHEASTLGDTPVAKGMKAGMDIRELFCLCPV